MSFEWHDNLFYQKPLLMFEFYQTIQLWPFSASYDVVTQVILMMTHRLSITDQHSAGFTTWQDTQHLTVTGPWSHLKLECPVKTTSELGWGARNPKPTENAASVSPSILVKLRSRGSPQCFSCYWPQSHNGSDSNLKTQLEEWAPLHIMVTVTCTYDV